MVSAERIRELLGNPTMSDEETEEIRDMARALAEIMFQAWRKKNNKDENEH